MGTFSVLFIMSSNILLWFLFSAFVGFHTSAVLSAIGAISVSMSSHMVCSVNPSCSVSGVSFNE